MSYLSKVILVLTGLFTYSCADICVDKLPDCADYTKSSCQGLYVSWAYTNCRAFCGYCHQECVNKRSDCHEFGPGMCHAPYVMWAKENCAKYCGLCGPEMKCLYTPWLDESPCSKTCGGGVKDQVRAFTLVPKGTLLARDCNNDLTRKTSCNVEPCTTKGSVKNPLVGVDPAAVVAAAVAGAAANALTETGAAAGTAVLTETGAAAGTAVLTETGAAAGTAVLTETGAAAGTAILTETGAAAGTAALAETGAAIGTVGLAETGAAIGTAALAETGAAIGTAALAETGAAIGTAVLAETGIEAFAEFVLPFLFLGKRDINYEEKAFEDIVKSVLKSQSLN